MPLFVSQMFDELADLLEEVQPPHPNPVTFDMKRQYLNMGQYAMWPRIYRIAQDTTLPLVDGTQEYIFPESVAGGRLVYVELETEVDSDEYFILGQDQYTVIPGPGRRDILKVIYGGASTDGFSLRITTSLPLLAIVAVDDAAAALEEYSGPDFSIEGPVLYAMNRITARGLHARLDYGRQSAQYQNRTAVPNELMSSSIFWLDEFERRLDEWKLVHPQSVG